MNLMYSAIMSEFMPTKLTLSASQQYSACAHHIAELSLFKSNA